MRTQATCHPDRPNKSYGLCTTCYARKKYWDNPEKYREVVQRYRRNNLAKAKECQKNTHRKKKYGITLDEFNAWSASLNNCCQICGIDKGTTLHIDHCHTTNKVRGLLCSNCNRNLGWFESRQENILNYLALTLHEIKLNYDHQTT